MHISPLRKNIPLTVVTLAALGIMFFLFFMHPSTRRNPWNSTRRTATA
ncbi:MAG: hypothetical protein ACLT8E_05920 [Akkermansia sp.]